MENAIEALEIACVTVLLAMAIIGFIFLNSASKEGDRIVLNNISREWLIDEGEQ